MIFNKCLIRAQDWYKHSHWPHRAYISQNIDACWVLIGAVKSFSKAGQGEVGVGGKGEH